MKIYLLYNDQRIAKKKTHVKKRTLNPVFNESFVFELPHLGDDGLKHVSLEFMLLDWDRVTKNEVNSLQFTINIFNEHVTFYSLQFKINSFKEHFTVYSLLFTINS